MAGLQRRDLALEIKIKGSETAPANCLGNLPLQGQSRRHRTACAASARIFDTSRCVPRAGIISGSVLCSLLHKRGLGEILRDSVLYTAA